MARKFNNGNLHSEADAEIGQVVFAAVLRGDNFSLNSSVAEAAGNNNSAAVGKKLRDVFPCNGFRVNPLDLNE